MPADMLGKNRPVKLFSDLHRHVFRDVAKSRLLQEASKEGKNGNDKHPKNLALCITESRIIDLDALRFDKLIQRFNNKNKEYLDNDNAEYWE